MYRAFLILLAAGALFGQESALARLKREAASSKTESSAAALHAALRDWTESRLPADRGMLEITSGHLESDLQEELKAAGLAAPEAPDSVDQQWGYPGFGYVDVNFQRLPELPDTLFVTAGASIPCGYEDTIYMYHFDAAGRKRVLADHPKEEGYGDAELGLSDPDPQGRRLLLIHRLSQQCASTWMGLTYSVDRLGVLPGDAETLLSGQHGFWMGNDGPEFVLKPDELIMEFLDMSVDVVIHNRTQVHRYNFAEGVRRLDPVALQPQDFAEEWLTRPWSEMESRSAPDTQEWHAKLHADFVLGNYQAVVPCTERPGRWMIELEINHIGEKDLSEPIDAYFLVRDLGNYRYRMESVSDDEPQGCPGEGIVNGWGHASDKHPWLSAAELKALR
jgi:hypothetical protein